MLGARNHGGAITRDLLAHGMRVATVARTDTDLRVLEADGAIPIRADAADAKRPARALIRAAHVIGPVDLIVNAVSPTRPPDDGTGFGGGALTGATMGGFGGGALTGATMGGFGGGALTGATMAGFEGWTVPAARQAFVFLGSGDRALNGRGGDPGAGHRRTGAPGQPGARAGRGGWRRRPGAHARGGAGAPRGRHPVVLLIVDGIIESPRMAADKPREALVRQEDVVAAVRFLATQTARGMTHELVITAGGDRWLP